jgi:hypothetical protein
MQRYVLCALQLSGLLLTVSVHRLKPDELYPHSPLPTMAPYLVDDILGLIYEHLSDQGRETVAFLSPLFLYKTLRRRYSSVVVCCEPEGHKWLQARLR